MALEVVELPRKGRCLLSRHDIKRGEMACSESPLFGARPCDRPELFHYLSELHEKMPFALGHIRCHYAALLTYASAPLPMYEAVLTKGVPQEEVAKTTLTEVTKIVEELHRSGSSFCSSPTSTGRLWEDLSSEVFRELILAWEWNGFKGLEPDELFIYESISTAAHSCDPNCESVVLSGLFRSDGAEAASSTIIRKGDRFQQRYAGLGLRALRDVKEGEELTFSYCLYAKELAGDFMERRRELNRRGWQFTCACQRCCTEEEEYRQEHRRGALVTDADVHELDGIDVAGLFEDC
eukprot:TRINITY_DN46593_c0_g1_i1.p1 TRINITY_DN46593_c0_g1~~TRINITY_DN46593_c0_g1_i1.p1  ORF type:complete len:326 (+),score=22.15 TRINITY_DN46593_c0_g1_i1:99-980(+)